MDKNIEYLIAINDKRRNNDEYEWREYAGQYVSMHKFDDDIIVQRAYSYAVYLMVKPVNLIPQDILAGHFKNPGHGEFSNNPKRSEWKGRLNEEPAVLYDDPGINEQQRLIIKKIMTGIDIGLFARAPDGHVVPGFERMLRYGIDTLLLQAKEKYTSEIDSTKRSFYKATYISLLGLQKMIENYMQKAIEILHRTNDPKSKQRMNQIIEACRNIMHKPPESFMEAVQLVCFTHEAVLGEAAEGSYSLGRLDYYLYPFYCADRDKGILDEEQLKEICIALWIKLAENRLSWQNVTLGGCDEEGNHSYNELTIIFLECSRKIKKDQPQVSLRVTGDMPDLVWEEAFELLKEGRGFPSFFQDEKLCNTRMNMGASLKDARNVSIVGCVEPTVGGKEFSHTEGMRINWLKILELVLNQGKCMLTEDKWELKEQHLLSEIQTFDEFYEWFKREFENVIETAIEYMQIADLNYPKLWPKPLLSATMEGCMEKGMDVTEGGTLYNLSTINAVGIASTVNSLEAIRKSVFEEQWLSFDALQNILKENFNGNEKIRQRLQNVSKYGNHEAVVDEKMREMTGYFVNILERYKNPRMGGYQAGFYTSYFHGRMGKRTGASADGRLAEEAMSASLSPAAGTDIKGPTAVIQSALSIPMDRFNNCMVLDMKFTSTFLDSKKHLMALRNLIEVYFDKGGMEIQFNIVDRETLLKAQKNPSKYQNLIVRVSGYSGYFVTLETTVQNEIIKRTENQRI